MVFYTQLPELTFNSIFCVVLSKIDVYINVKFNINNKKFTGPNLNVTLICPDCKQFPPDLIERFSEGDIICGQCGLVLSDRIVDTRSEWRTFQNDDKNTDDPSRVGDASNSLYDTEDLTTMISYALILIPAAQE